MLSFQYLLCIFVALFVFGNARPSTNHWSGVLPKKPKCRTIMVDKSGHGNFTTIQAAINAVPPMSKNWFCIRVSAGEYKEQVLVPYNKPRISLEGAGKRKTTIVWNAHDSISGATFTSQADNFIAKALTFINSYNYPLKGNGNPRVPAVAALIQGDKSAFYRVGFIGVQDTLWDVQGRHYFEKCTIQGAVDFIFGSGQSLYERCTIAFAGEAIPGGIGYITAQGRGSAAETNGFVFKDSVITGNGQTYLGRPWRAYARVLFFNTKMSSVIVVEGWDAWHSTGNESTLSFDESDCDGVGSNKRKRVKWANKLRGAQVRRMASLSFIDGQTWLYRQ